MGIAERKEREKEQRKNDIVDAAEKVFFEKGFYNSTVDDVAKEAELSKGTLYLYFKSKEEIHFAITRRGVSILNGMMEKSVSHDKTGHENLVELGNAFVEFSGKNKKYFESMLQMEFSKTVMDLTYDELTNLSTKDSPITLLFATVEKGVEDGSIRNDINITQLAVTLWAQLMGVLQIASTKERVFESFNITKEDIIKSHFELVRTGIITKI